MADLEKVYRHRFSDIERDRMTDVWAVLTRHYFNKWLKPTDAVIDIGAGLCNFINQVSGSRRVAFDADPSVAQRVADGVEFIQGESLDSKGLENAFDVAFLSNFLEHLESSDAVLEMLGTVSRILKPGGRVIILQPNFALTGAAYFDFIDHKTILTDKSTVEALELTGFSVEFVKKRFLPYTSKSRIPKKPWMVRLYLMCPPAQYFMAGQSLVIGRKST